MAFVSPLLILEKPWGMNNGRQRPQARRHYRPTERVTVTHCLTKYSQTNLYGLNITCSLSPACADSSSGIHHAKSQEFVGKVKRSKHETRIRRIYTEATEAKEDARH